MNKELDKLLCLLDGKITAYRMINKLPNNDIRVKKLIDIQHNIQTLWSENKNNKGIVKGGK